MILTVIIPVYNEENTILKILKKIEMQKFVKKQIIVINDGSTDLSLKKIKTFKFQSNFKILSNKKNYGKGACIIKAKKYIRGDIVIIQDADLEYYPEDYKKILNCFKNSNNLAVYGSRVLNKNRYNNKSFTSNFRILANHILTIFSNFVNNQNLTDAHTCYKAVRAEIFKKINLCDSGFSFCPELTTKLSNLNIPIVEVSIKYNGRNFSEGKKIRFSDGIIAFLTIIKYRFYKWFI